MSNLDISSITTTIMSSGSFPIEAVLAFMIAGLWVSGTTYLAEKIGSRRGGLITKLPSNIVISFLFIALSKGIPFTAEAARAVPIGMAVTTLFIIVFIVVLPAGLAAAVTSSLAVWVVFSIVASMFPINHLGISLLIYLCISLGGFLYLEYGTSIKSVPKKQVAFHIENLCIRALFAGTIVASVVLLAQIIPAHVTGIVASFPAVTLSSLLILYYTQGKEFTRAVGKLLVLSSSNIIVYAFGVAVFYPLLGIVGGTIVSFLCAFLWVTVFIPLSNRIK